MHMRPYSYSHSCRNSGRSRGSNRSRRSRRAVGVMIVVEVGVVGAVAVVIAHVAEVVVVILSGSALRCHGRKSSRCCIFILPTQSTALSLRGCLVSGFHACASNLAHAGICTPTSCRGRCRPRSGRSLGSDNCTLWSRPSKVVLS